jgi:hypothetical protein
LTLEKTSRVQATPKAASETIPQKPKQRTRGWLKLEEGIQHGKGERGSKTVTADKVACLYTAEK